MENIYQKFAALQKHAQEYSVKLNLDTSKQSILQPKAQCRNVYQWELRYSLNGNTIVRSSFLN